MVTTAADPQTGTQPPAAASSAPSQTPSAASPSPSSPTAPQTAGVTPTTPAPTAAAPGVTTPEPTTPATTPTAPVSPILPEPVVPEIDPRDQHIQLLEQQQAAAQEQLDRQGLASFTADTARNLQEKYGMEPDQANEMAGQIGQAHWQAYAAQNRERAQAKKMVSFVQEAAKLADAHKIPIMTLIQYPTLQAMRQAVRGLEAQGRKDAELVALKAQVEKLTKGQVPAQQFASGQGAPSGGEKPTSENIDALYVKDPVRYQAAYRTFLRTGQIP